MKSGSSNDRRNWVAEVVRRFLDEEAAQRGCKVIEFPKRAVRSALRELRDQLNTKDEQAP